MFLKVFFKVLVFLAGRWFLEVGSNQYRNACWPNL